MNPIERVLANTEEVITKDELVEKLKKGGVRGYIGFEPSGLIHIGWLIWARKVQDLVNAGVEMTILAATWHAWINDKLGGDMNLIKDAANMTWHFLNAVGINMKEVNFINSEEIVSDDKYWMLVLKVAKRLSLARVRRAITIMGRREEEANLDFSKLIYPCMQVADIFYLDLDIVLGGMDQRKAHVLAREVAPKLGFKKPTAIHTPLLVGLHGITSKGDITESKMSKSKPESCIFVHDEPDLIMRKIRKAYCPPRQVEGNPILEINRLILFSKEEFALYIDRPSKYGGPVHIESYSELVEMYKAGKIHPLDLKNATAKALIKELEPIRRYVKENPEVNGILKRLERIIEKREVKLR
ncbi:MAG: tyrosine--tRNA ligase [Thermoprotei archaeon]|nr:MAG: tyrosine--tRNA ligase [Thermoprotei archaeon]RLF19894.1 MAG: tyrosine--tRNA ligase [Thermoprotei archaeon]